MRSILKSKRFWYLFAILLFISLSAYFINTTQSFAVNRITTYGEFQYVAPVEIKAVLQDMKITRNIFTIQISDIAKGIKILPWVKHVSVSRKMPDQIVIKVIEREPLALWNKSGVITADGSILYPKVLHRKLLESSGIPTFNAGIADSSLIVQHYKEIQQAVATIDLGIRSISLNKVKELKIQLNNGIKVVFGNKDLPTRLNRFILAYGKELHNHFKAIDYVDLQYTNGFAIGWKKGVKRPKIGEEI